MTYRYMTFGNESVKSLKSVSKFNGYKVFAPAELEGTGLGFIPRGLLQKSDSVIVVCSGNEQGTAYAMVLCNRYDEKEKKFNQEPIAIVYSAVDDTTASGFVWHHANYDARNIEVPSGYQGWIKNTGIGYCIPLPNFPPNVEGPLEELQDTNNLKIFERVITRLVKDQEMPEKWDGAENL